MWYLKWFLDGSFAVGWFAFLPMMMVILDHGLPDLINLIHRPPPPRKNPDPTHVWAGLELKFLTQHKNQVGYWLNISTANPT